MPNAKNARTENSLFPQKLSLATPALLDTSAKNQINALFLALSALTTKEVMNFAFFALLARLPNASTAPSQELPVLAPTLARLHPLRLLSDLRLNSSFNS